MNLICKTMTDTDKWRLTDKVAKWIVRGLEIGFFVAFVSLCIAVHCQRRTIEALKGKAQTERADTVKTAVPMAALPAATHVVMH